MIGATAAIAAASLVAFTAGSAHSGPGTGFGHNLSVGKVVTGVATGSFIVQVECTVFNDGLPQTWDLPFLPDGSPDPAAPIEVTDDWNINDGVWIRADLVLDSEECIVTETQNGGAVSTSYTCEYVPALDIGPVSAKRKSTPDAVLVAYYGVPQAPGCSEPAGATGPTIRFGLPRGCFGSMSLGVLQLQLEPPLLCRDQALVTVINNFPLVVDPVAITFTG